VKKYLTDNSATDIRDVVFSVFDDDQLAAYDAEVQKLGAA
jgi:hypothetical protein